MPDVSPNNQPGFELPQPTIEQAVTPVASEAAPMKSEQQSRAPELPSGAMPATPPAPATPQPSALTDDPLPAASASSLSSMAPAIADDADLIEKEWVDKAKAIVEHTRDDPHMQSKKLNEFKTDYMKKRYGKEIKLTEE